MATDLSREIAKVLREYKASADEAIRKSADKHTKEGVKKLKATSPSRTGRYAASWTRKRQGSGWIIHAKRYQVSHLLEKGHALKSGGRVRAIPHIKPVEQEIIEKFTHDVEEALRQ